MTAACSIRANLAARVNLDEPFLGVVATRGYGSAFNLVSGSGVNSRTFHYVRKSTPTTHIGIALPNWVISISGSRQQGGGGPMTATAKLEYPIGNPTRIPFTFGGGNSSGTVADNGTLESDLLPVVMQPGDQFILWLFRTSAGGGIPCFSEQYIYVPGGDAVEVSSTDKTGGNYTNGGFWGAFPGAIFGPTTDPSPALFGDSRMVGATDTTDASGDTGPEARAFGQYWSYINCGMSGEAALDATTATGRIALAKFCTHVVCEYGYWDVQLAESIAQIFADYQALKTAMSPREFIQQTITPQTTGAWTLVDHSDQTLTAEASARNALNAAIRADHTVIDRVFDFQPLVSDAAGFWFANGTPQKFTPDGLHETQYSNNLAKALVTPAYFPASGNYASFMRPYP